MLKNILNLNGIQKLNKQAQTTINGGGLTCDHQENVRHCASIDYPACPSQDFPPTVMHYCCLVEFGLDVCI